MIALIPFIAVLLSTENYLIINKLRQINIIRLNLSKQLSMSLKCYRMLKIVSIKYIVPSKVRINFKA